MGASVSQATTADSDSEESGDEDEEGSTPLPPVKTCLTKENLKRPVGASFGPNGALLAEMILGHGRLYSQVINLWNNRLTDDLVAFPFLVLSAVRS